MRKALSVYDIYKCRIYPSILIPPWNYYHNSVVVLAEGSIYFTSTSTEFNELNIHINDDLVFRSLR